MSLPIVLRDEAQAEFDAAFDYLPSSKAAATPPLGKPESNRPQRLSTSERNSLRTL